jgi:hypothetical protein
VPGRRSRIQALHWKGTNEQSARISEWLQADSFQPAVGEPIGLDFYENIQGIETVV